MNNEKIDIDLELLEKTVNEILPGLSMYVRDVNLSPVCASKYVPGTIIMERGFTDASSRVMGMVTTHRISILSNHMADLGEYEHDTNWGLFVAKNNSHFKILDVYNFNGKTQILLLHLPDDNRWKLFENVKLNIEDQIVEDSRKRFENKCVQDAVPELCTEEWLGRCAAPLGMDDNGVLFDLNPVLQSEMRKIPGTPFREFYHRFVYLDCRDILTRLMEDSLTDEDTGVVAYGYIDEQCGLSFQPVKIASLRNNQIILRDTKEKVAYIIRIGSLENDSFLDLSYTDIDLGQFSDFEKMIRDNYDTKNPDKEELRSMAFLDQGRHEFYPDDIAVLLFRGELQPEQVWVRANKLSDNAIYGELLNEPNQDFSVHCGDQIQIIPYKKDSGEIVCISSFD